MRYLLALLSGHLLLAGCGAPGDPEAARTPAAESAAPVSRAAGPVEETARLNEWLDARFEEQLDFSPIFKTVLGRKEDNDRIDDFSEAAQDAQLEWRRATVRELQASFDRDSLMPEAQISYDLWIYRLQEWEDALPFRRHEYLFHQMQAEHTGLPNLLINFHRVDEPADMEAYVARIGEVGRAVEQLTERARLAAEEGVRPPRFAYEAVLEQARALVTGAPFAGDGAAPLWSDAQAEIAALSADGKIGEPQAAALRAAASAALVERFKPAYEALIAWVEEDLPRADAVGTGVGKLPNGSAYYAQRLHASTTTRMTAEEIHELGLREVARIQAEMEAIKRSVGFEGTLQEFFAFVRDDPQFYFPNTDEGREAYLQTARDYLAAIEQRLPEYFGLLPKGSLVVKRVEAFREQPGAAQHYMQGTPDGSRPATFYAHLSDMRAMPKPQLESIAYHEGLPGHHMQIAIAQELQGLPVFRTQSDFTAFAEGWGLYAESLAKEMGGYADPYPDFGRLTAEIWRAVRLVVDTGLHAKGWTEEQAVEYFGANTPISPGQIRAEVRRYIVMPGQATAYKIGMLKIQELRAQAQAALGERFDIRGFHDAVLGGGALPLDILERRVNAWVASR